MNIRSINKNLDELNILLNQVDNTFDFIILTETWRITDISLFCVNGYQLFYNEGSFNKNDGVIIYAKEKFQCYFKTIELHHVKIIELRTELYGKRILPNGIYRPGPTCEYTFIRDLENYIKTYKSCDFHIIAGYINILNTEENFVHEYLNTLSAEVFWSLINRRSRVVRYEGSCIDHMLYKMIF